MSVIIISFEIDSNNDIKIFNENNGNSLIVSYEKKYISALSVYDVLSYKSGDKYQFKELGIEKISDGKIVEYFNEIVNMFKKICNEVSSLTIKDPDDDISEIDSLDEEGYDDLPF